MNVLSFSSDAQQTYDRLRKQRIRIATMDLRIASVAVVTDSTLRSRNLQDFRQVPGLRVEDWTI
jgi:tRNA(fMet)-specific endonuclease VapC